MAILEMFRRRFPPATCGILCVVLVIFGCLFDLLDVSSQIGSKSAVVKLIPLRMTAERKAENNYLGCFVLSDLQQFIMQRINLTISTTSPFVCTSHCTKHQFMYSYHQPLFKTCNCDNIFHTKGLVEKSCTFNDTKETEVYMTDQTTKIKYRKMSEIWQKSNCTCADEACTSLQCHIVRADSICWVGPSSESLTISANGTCAGYQLITAVPYNSAKTYCVPDMFGFLPTFSCDPWKYKSLDQARLYYIKSSQVTVRIPLESKREENKLKVLIVAYYRSGSTFLSEFFQGHPDSYYLYEPLYGLTSSLRYGAHEGPNNPIHASRTIEQLDRIYRCQFDGVPLSSLAFSTHKLDSFYTGCRSGASDIRLSCLQTHHSSCLSSQLITIKAIRVKLGWTENLLKNPQHQNLKIVLLLRDPRGLFNSRRKGPGLSKSHSRVYCQTLMEDFEAALYLRSLGYGRQILIIRYEDLAKNKMAAAENIYASLSLGEMPESLKQHLVELSKPVSSKSQFYSTHREDSMATAYKWKSVMKYSVVKEIDQECSDAYKAFGYLPVESYEQLKNFSNFHKTKAPW